MSAPDVIGTLSSTLHAVHKLYVFVQSYKSASNEMKSFCASVQGVEGLLSQIKDDAHKTDAESNASLNALKFQPCLIEHAEELVKGANTFLKKATIAEDVGREERGSGWQSGVAKMKNVAKKVNWTFKAQEVKDLAVKLQEFYGKVSAVYSVGTSATVGGMETAMLAIQPNIIHAMQEEMGRLLGEHREDMVRAISFTLMSAAREQREGHSQAFDEVSILRDDPQATHGLHLTDTHPTVPGVCKTITYLPDDGPPLTSVSTSKPEIISTCGAPRVHDSTFTRISLTTSYLPHIATRSVCPLDCRCRCHKPSRDYILSVFRPWVGGLNISKESCDDRRCMKPKRNLLVVKLWLPTWFAQAEASIRAGAFPVHIVIQTPRVVNIHRLFVGMSLEEFQKMIWTGEITVNDVVATYGLPILHSLVLEAGAFPEYTTVMLAMMQFLISAGARHDWEYNGLTVTEYLLLWFTNHVSENWPALLQCFERTIGKPLLQEDMEDAWESLRVKMQWSDLHYLVANPLSSPEQLKKKLDRVLRQHSATLDANARDREGTTPLEQAIRSCPSAIDALLRAGVNPGHISFSPLHTAVYHHSWTTIGPLVRAGAFKRDISRVLHGVIHMPTDRGDMLHTALELMRHAGHLLDCNINDNDGRILLEEVAYYAKRYSDGDEFTSVYELYKSQRLPINAQLIDRSRTAGEEMEVLNLETISLIKAGLEGDVEAIGELIRLGAMVNERDAAGRTLLHLVAMGIVPNGYAIALEVVRNGGYGVDWDALTVDGETVEELAVETCNQPPASVEGRQAATETLELLRRRILPVGIAYIYPCMHPEYCGGCSTFPCSGDCDDGLRMPGSFRFIR